MNGGGHVRLLGFDRGFAPGSLPILNNGVPLQGRTTTAVPRGLIGIDVSNRVIIDWNSLGTVFASYALATGGLFAGPNPPGFTILGLDARGQDIQPYQALTNGSAGNYTYANGAMVLVDLAGQEILRIWATDPNPLDFNSGNLYIGRQAGFNQPTDNVTAGFQNLGIGDAALFNILTGQGNTAVGYQPLNGCTTGTGNTAVGRFALLNVSAGAGNVAVGDSAGFSAIGNDVARNTLIGQNAGFALLTGGDDNTLIGNGAGANIDVGARNIIIGSGVNAPAASGSDQLNIGNALQGDLSTKQLQVVAPFQLGVFQVGTLPVPPAAGYTAFVTDEMVGAFGAPAAGGGVIPVPVYYDGAVWVVG